MHAPVLGSIVLSSATSWIVLHLILGDEPLFHVPAYQLVHPAEFLFYAVLGVVGGLVSVAFVKLLLWQRGRFLRMPKSTQWLQPTAGGVLVGLLGWFFPDVLGVGYVHVGQALNGQMLLTTMALLVCLKLLATATCYASGNAGGIFGPSLFIGAMMGGSVGAVAHLMAPDYTGSVGAYALVGMGAAFAGIVRVPLTSVIMIFEMTRDYSIIVPLMISNLMSYFISSRLQEEPIYEALQHQDGIHLPGGARAREALLTVGHAYRIEPQVLSATGQIAQAVASIDRDQLAWPVVDQSGLRGMIRLEELEAAIEAGRGSEPLAALVPEPGPVETLTGEHFPHVHADHPLDMAMRRLASSGYQTLPVVSRTNVRDLKGTISIADVLQAYQAADGNEQQSDLADRAKTPAPLLAGVLIVLVGLATLAGFLNYYYRAERTARAQRYYQSGNELLAKDRVEEAIEQYRNAVSVSHSTQHRLALGLALEKSKRLDEARIYLNEVIRESPSNGPANAGLARIETQGGDIDRALVNYQRAVDGTWPEKAAEKRFQTRLEMVEALQKAGRRVQAQSELLAAAGAVPEDPSMQKQVGRMLIDYGLPQQAAGLYHQVLARNPQDAGTWDGLGEAEFAAGNYRAAHDAFDAALKIEPADPVAAKRVDLLDRVFSLNPAARGIGAAERYRRSRELLGEVIADREACNAAETPAVQTAKSQLARKQRPPSWSDAAEANMTLAGQIWKQRPASCSARNGELAILLK